MRVLWTQTGYNHLTGFINFFRQEVVALAPPDILELGKRLEGEAKQIKYNIFKLCWYMRGGVSSHELFWEYSIEDRTIINDIIKENIETTNKTGMNLI